MEINIDLGGIDPPEGRACHAGRRDWLPFIGWLELISALERLIDAGGRPLPAALASEDVAAQDA